MPMYLLVFGLRMREAAGAGLLVIAALAIPTLATHWALGHIDWTVAGAFALGAIPTSIASGRLAQRVAGTRLRHAFGWFLIGSGIAFIVYRLAGHRLSRYPWHRHRHGLPSGRGLVRDRLETLGGTATEYVVVRATPPDSMAEAV